MTNRRAELTIQKQVWIKTKTHSFDVRADREARTSRLGSPHPLAVSHPCNPDHIRHRTDLTHGAIELISPLQFHLQINPSRPAHSHFTRELLTLIAPSDNRIRMSLRMPTLSITSIRSCIGKRWRSPPVT